MSKDTLTISPHVDKTKKAYQKAFGAYQPVSIYATALHIVAADLDALSDGDQPDWFGPIAEAIDSADQHGQAWLTDIGPAATTGLIQMLIDYERAFEQEAMKLVNLIDEVPDDGPSPDQKVRIGDLLSDMSDATSDRQNTVDALNGKLEKLTGKFEEDHKRLSDARHTVETHISDGNVVVQKLQKTLGDDFLESSCDGPLDVSVQLKSDIETKMRTDAGGHPEVMFYVIAGAELSDLVGDLGKALDAMSGVLTVWKTIEGKIDAAAQSLERAEGEDYTHALQSLDVATAMQQWQQLSTFAQRLRGNWD